MFTSTTTAAPHFGKRFVCHAALTKIYSPQDLVLKVGINDLSASSYLIIRNNWSTPVEKWKTQSLIFKMFHHERRFIQFIVLARCRIWPPLDGAAHRFKKKSNMPSFSFIFHNIFHNLSFYHSH